MDKEMCWLSVGWMVKKVKVHLRLHFLANLINITDELNAHTITVFFFHRSRGSIVALNIVIKHRN